MKKILLGIFLGVVAWPLAGSAVTSEAGAPAEWSVSVGGGVLFRPAFTGSSDYQWLAVPSIKVRYGEDFFASVEQGIGYNFIRQDGWTAGPLLKPDFGRKADGSSPFRVAGRKSTALRGFADVDAAMEVGAFVHHTAANWTTQLEVGRGLGGHEGFKASLAIDWTQNLRGATADRTRGPLLFVSGPRVKWADASYHEAYFGINPATALAAGLPVYRAGSGFSAVGWSAALVAPLDRRLSLVGLINYERLLGPAADSPLVRLRGSANQLTTGLFLAYKL
ncbi:MAG: MipA/OmpV family protein [Opitutaceae bacterium]|nr:MipA/OmpV family protein [Opitutaceae bacterium]MBP9911873.1 MipA/OmpV family protein [Opitutaceae bacterium]